MQLGGDGEVEPVVFAGVESPQELDRLLATTLLLAQRLRPADCEVTHRTRARGTTELGQGPGQLGVDSDLDTPHNP